MTPSDILPYPVQPSSGKLSLAANENKYKEPQPDITKRERDLGTLSPK